MKNSFLFLLVGLIPYLTLNAQSTQFTEEDSLYFVQQLPRYERWLDNEGFGALLEVYEVDPDPDMVTLVLKSVIPDADSTLSAWRKMKKNYTATHLDSLEARLFHVFCKIMQVPKDMAVIEVYNDIGDKIPCFYRGIYWDEGELRTIPRFCMNKQSVVIIEDFRLRPGIKVSSTSLEGVSPEKLTRLNLEKEIRSFFKKYYKEKRGTLEFLNQSNALVYLEVSELRREVLTDEANPALANFLNWFGLDLDWVKREYLTIKVTYVEEDGQRKIELDIEGEYGSGFHQPRRTAYMSMEPEFEVYVAKYANKLAEKIKVHLTE